MGLQDTKGCNLFHLQLLNAAGIIRSLPESREHSFEFIFGERGFQADTALTWLQEYKPVCKSLIAAESEAAQMYPPPDETVRV
ncbi:MAG: hypothetical protein DMG80_15290 [Acidobacteria bacterium]|nr:MAG: hypothetical protein DMG80_15290 [Acidobacteriota bacterium]